MSLKDEYFAMMTSQFRRWDARFGMLTDHPGPAVVGPASSVNTPNLASHRLNCDVIIAKYSSFKPMA